MNEKDRRLFETISAYIDGESDKPREVERLIETDAEAARLHRELSWMSMSMQALPAPEVHPAFATRIVAHVREQAVADAAPAWRFVFPKLLGGLAAVVAIGFAVWPFVQYGRGGITTPSPFSPRFVLPTNSLMASSDGLSKTPKT